MAVRGTVTSLRPKAPGPCIAFLTAHGGVGAEALALLCPCYALTRVCERPCVRAHACERPCVRARVCERPCVRAHA